MTLIYGMLAIDEGRQIPSTLLRNFHTRIDACNLDSYSLKNEQVEEFIQL